MNDCIVGYAGLIAAASGQLDALLKKSQGAKVNGYTIGKGVSGLQHYRYGGVNVNVGVGMYKNSNGLHV